MRNNYGDLIHMEILTDDREVWRAVWQLQNEARERGENGFQITELLQRSFTSADFHQVWVLFNDTFDPALFLTALCYKLRTVIKTGKRLELKISADLNIKRGDTVELKKFGFHLKFENEAKEPEGTLELPTSEDSAQRPSSSDISE